jgi:hypothetical protein
MSIGMLGRGYPFNSSLYALHREKREYVVFRFPYSEIQYSLGSIYRYEITYNGKIRKEEALKKCNRYETYHSMNLNISLQKEPRIFCC